MSARFQNSFAAVVGAVSLAVSGAAFAAPPCQGPGAPTNTDTKCKTAVQLPPGSAPMRSFDISWVNPHRAEYYLAERSNAAIVIIDTHSLTFKRFLTGFVGIKNNPNGSVNNNISGPDGVVTHGRWLYAGDGNSDLRVYDLDAPAASAFKENIPTGGKTRVDEMAVTTDGELLLVANNAEDPPFGTLFAANGDRSFSNVRIIQKILVDDAVMPKDFGLSIEQPAWDPKTKRFYTSLPVIANNPPGCNFNADTPPVTCHGGLLVVDPANLQPSYGLFDQVKGGVVPLNLCSPNGATVGPNDNLLLGCTPQNNPSDTSTLVINAATRHFANIGGITGSDEVWFNKGDRRYYTASNRDCGKGGGCPAPAGTRAPGGAVLGVIDAETNLLIEKIPQGQNSHSVAADSKRNLIFVPQTGPTPAVPNGDTTDVGAGICGGNNGCIAVYSHHVDRDRDDRDRDDRDKDDHEHDH
jgi:hypothetical protein